MYGYEMDYNYEPATEGIKSFFESVLDMCRKAGQMIKEFIDKVAYALKKMVNDPDTVKKESGKATAEIKKIGKDIDQLLKDATADIDLLVQAWAGYAKRNKISGNDVQNKANKKADSGAARVFEKTENNTTTYSSIDFSKQNGMDDLDTKAMEKDRSISDEWGKIKARLGESFAESEKTATEISARLKGLSQYGRLTYSATKGGYDSLREIFDANGKFGDKWKKIQSAAEWATGNIKISLNKIVSMYKVGISATQAFGRRLERGNVATNKGEAYKGAERKGVMAEGKAMNRVYDEYTQSRDLSYGKKDKNRQNWAGSLGRNADLDANKSTAATAAGYSGSKLNKLLRDFYNDNGANGANANKQRLSEADYKAIMKGTDAQKRTKLAQLGVTESTYALDRLYQAAYEDAYNDIQAQQYYQDVFDSVPGAFEFVEEDADFDAYDYEDEMIYDYDPLSEEDVYSF